MLLCGTCDLPARAMVYNMTQFNGKYGCTHCKQSGEQLLTSATGGVHVYPYIGTDPTGPLPQTQKSKCIVMKQFLHANQFLE